MTLRFTSVFHKLVDAVTKDKKLIVLYGGSSSSKTISILQYLMLYGLKYPNKRITIGGESLPILKKTIIPDLKQKVFKEAWDDSLYNKTDMVYSLPNGSVINFIPADDANRWHGMRSDITYFDELYNIPEAVFQQASIRTSERIFASFNPVSRFYITKYWDDASCCKLHSTYLDNPFLSDTIISALETRISKDSNFKNVYLLGLWGNLEGLVFKEHTNWDIVDKLPESGRDIIGLDFGYTNDPTAIVRVRYYNGDIYLDEIAYQKGLLNSNIYSLLPNNKIIADSAEPKSIDEIANMGADIHPAVKGAGSINAGINLLKEFKIYITSNSINIIKEFRNYSWAKDKDGVSINKPVDAYNHSIDALRYAVKDMLSGKNIKFI